MTQELDITTPEPALGKHGFISYEGHAGECKSAWADKTGFSLGVFQWVPRADGRGLKPGPVKVRVKGVFSKAALVYQKARALCVELDNGGTASQKSFTL